MAERFDTLSEEQLGEALFALRNEVNYPSTPDLAATVREGLRDRAAKPTNIWSNFWRQPRQLAAIAAVVAVLIVVAVLLYPSSRNTVADWFDLPGVTLFSESTETLPALGGPLQLGDPVTLDDARSQAAYPVLTPDVDWLDEPDEVYFDSEAIGGRVSFVYHADDPLPAAEETGVGILLSQFQGQLNPGMYGKGMPAGVQLEVFELNGETAYWISGRPHTLSYYDAGGDYIQDSIRLAGNTLLWQDGELTLRLESALDFDSALEIAQSMR